jgi:hypothetical protein
MKTRRFFITSTAVLMLAGTALAGTTFRLEQDTGSGSGYAYLTDVTAFTTDKTLSGFYGTGNFDGDGEMANATLTYDRSHIFLVDSSVDGLGLFIVHNRVGSGDNDDGIGQAEMGLTFSSGNATVVKEDDSEGAYGDYYDYVSSGSGKVSAQWQWGDDWTDGLVAAFTPGSGETVTAKFTDVDTSTEDVDASTEFDDPNPNDGVTYETIKNLDDWYFYDPDHKADDAIQLDLVEDRAIRLTMLPVPPAAWPVVGMLGVIGLRKLRRSRMHDTAA